MKRFNFVVILSLVMITAVMAVACKKKNVECEINVESELDFEVGFSKNILGDEYYVGSHIAKSLTELNAIVGDFAFEDVVERYNENFFTTKSVIVFSFIISGGHIRDIKKIKIQDTELIIEYSILSFPGHGSFDSEIKFIEMDKDSVADVISIKEKLL
jgi:hypothetical protein